MLERSAKRPCRGGLPLCLLSAALVCLAQVLGSRPLLLTSLLLFLALQLGLARRGRGLAGLLFFLPWAKLLKLAPGGHTFFTYALLLAGAVCFLRGGGFLQARYGLPALLLLIWTLLAKIVRGFAVDFSYLAFFCLLFLFPSVAAEKCGFGELTAYFAFGVISAALSARALAGHDGIAQYIGTTAYGEVLRSSGFYGDPNFYAAQISAAFAGALVCLRRARGGQAAALLALLILLLYCGLQSASKTFALTIAVALVLWLGTVFLGRFWQPGRVFSGALLAGAMLLGALLFREVWIALAARFTLARDAATLTTGRTARWWDYFLTIFSDPGLLLLGQGLTNLNLHGWGAHSTPLQALYQFGLPGSVLLCGWLGSLFNGVCGRRRVTRPAEALVILVGAFLPWLALDMLLFDDFFLVAAYAFCGASACGADFP